VRDTIFWEAKSVTLLEGYRAKLARLSDRNNVEVKTLV
jgi:hypothetical protein